MEARESNEDRYHITGSYMLIWIMGTMGDGGVLGSRDASIITEQYRCARVGGDCDDHVVRLC